MSTKHLTAGYLALEFSTATRIEFYTRSVGQWIFTRVPVSDVWVSANARNETTSALARHISSHAESGRLRSLVVTTVKILL